MGLDRVKIGLQYSLLIIKGDQTGRSFAQERESRGLGHSRYGTIKIPPCSMPISV